MVVTKYTDIQAELQDVSSQNSQASGRVIINTNFHLLEKTTKSVWDILNAIYDPATEKILTLALMADVKVTGINAPNVGDALVWKGGYWAPAPPLGGGGGGAQFLTQLQDVVAYNYPIADKSILQYDIFQNKFQHVLLDIFALANSNLVPSAVPAVLTKDGANHLSAIAAGSANTWLSSDGTNIAFNFFKLANVSDVVTPIAPVVGQQYVMQFAGGNVYQMNPVPSLNAGIQYIIEVGQSVLVVTDNQYIVDQYLILDGDIDVEGELVIL